VRIENEFNRFHNPFNQLVISTSRSRGGRVPGDGPWKNKTIGGRLWRQKPSLHVARPHSVFGSPAIRPILARSDDGFPTRLTRSAFATGFPYPGEPLSCGVSRPPTFRDPPYGGDSPEGFDSRTMGPSGQPRSNPDFLSRLKDRGKTLTGARSHVKLPGGWARWRRREARPVAGGRLRGIGFQRSARRPVQLAWGMPRQLESKPAGNLPRLRRHSITPRGEHGGELLHLGPTSVADAASVGV
jgi:hypothetical protein